MGCGGASSYGGGSKASTPADSSGMSESAVSTASEAPASDFGGGSDASASPTMPAPAPPAAQGAPSQPGGSWRGNFEAEAKRAEVAPEPTDRPGLGTEWGETRSSSITTVSFTRAEPTNPFAMGSLFYNDEQGARAMANAAGFRRTSAGPVPVAGGALLVGLRDETGSFLSGFSANEKSFIVGEAGHRYTIVVRNRTPNRIECVISVDGLDVIDGRAGSFQKRGYLVGPHGELEIEGFRQSVDNVAAFRFGSVRGSYANQKHGETRNVGVIGFAFFHERGTNPFPWTNDEVQRRQDANPFPGQFASPP
ncbi:hypothetical protein E8A73_010820 [Polyangium aurulentum]|nr:hypothetical protein E8A73_010820 [Polyangium aurulentum]